MLFYDSTLSHLPYFYVTAQVLTNGSELEINHFKQAPLRALSKSLTTNKNLQVMKPKWTVKKLENGQIVQVYDELSDFKYFTIPWSHLAATMKDQPCWIFWYSPARFIHNQVSQVWSFPIWYLMLMLLMMMTNLRSWNECSVRVSVWGPETCCGCI